MLLNGPAEYCYVEAGAALPPPYRFTRNNMISIEEIDEFRKKHKNYGVFVTAYRCAVKDLAEFKKGEIYADFYLDFDKENDFEAVREDALSSLAFLKANFGIPYDESNIYFSGSKGVHIIISGELLGVTPCVNLNDVFKVMAKDIQRFLKNQTLDLKIYDRARMFRLPGSAHQKTFLYKIPLTYEELRSMNFEDIQTLALSPRPEFVKPTPPRNSLAETVFRACMARTAVREHRDPETFSELIEDGNYPCINWILENGAKEHGRNDTALALASHLKQRGLTKEQTLQQILAWNFTKLSDPMSEEEATRCAAQPYDKNYNAGCGKLKEVALCDRKNCDYRNKKTNVKFAPVASGVAPEQINVVTPAPVPAISPPVQMSEGPKVSAPALLDSKKLITPPTAGLFKNITRQLHDYEQEMLDTVYRVEAHSWSRDKRGGLSWGDKQWDDAFNGVQDGIYILGGQPNIGKSMLSLKLTWNIARCNKDAYVIYFALDDSDIDILPRVVAMDQKIPINVVKIPKRYENNPQLMEKRTHGLQNLLEAIDRFKMLDCKFGFTIEYVMQTILEHRAKLEAAQENKTVVAFVDNLYDLGTEEKISNENERIESIATRMRNFCRTYEVAMICTGEIKKLGQIRRPIVDDLKQGNKLQFVAKGITLCYNDVLFKKEQASVFHYISGSDQKMPVLEVDIVKNKSGDQKPLIFYNMIPQWSYLESVDPEGAKYYISQMKN
jgi:replicative DNA helicase